jgi:hypothetical protein
MGAADVRTGASSSGRTRAVAPLASVVRLEQAQRPSEPDGDRCVNPPLDLTDLPLMLTIDEAAAVLRISRTSAYKLAQLHRTTRGTEGLPHVRLGSRLLVRRVDLATIVGVSPLR